MDHQPRLKEEKPKKAGNYFTIPQISEKRKIAQVINKAIKREDGFVIPEENIRVTFWYIKEEAIYGITITDISNQNKWGWNAVINEELWKANSYMKKYNIKGAIFNEEENDFLNEKFFDIVPKPSEDSLNDLELNPQSSASKEEVIIKPSTFKKKYAEEDKFLNKKTFNTILKK